MIVSLSNKLIGAISIVAALMWTLAMGLVYGLMAATDDAWHWLNGLISMPPEFAAWLSAVSAWLLLVVWALGIVIVLLLALFARRLVNLIPQLHREGRS